MRWNVSSSNQNFNSPEEIINTLLENRGIVTPEDRKKFLNPPKILNMLKEMPEDFKESVRKARSIILKAVKNRIPIVIHGDYDADGICATTILYKTLKHELNHKKTFAFVPNRFEHGYGLSINSIDECVKNLNLEIGAFESAILITVDTGITSVAEAEYAKSKGFTLIITDHHQKPEILPNCDVLVWNDQVVGSGVSWILSRMLGSTDEQNLALVALATVTDLQPLFSYNRSIVKEGLEVLNTNPPMGIRALGEVAGKKGAEITTYDLGWVYGPRLNATGRIGSAEDALLLLLEEKEDLVLEHAKKLNQLNNERQDKTLEMYDLALEVSSNEIPKVLVTAHEDYHEGIIGLVASKLVQQHYRPAIVISINGEFGKGSVRSVPGVDIISLLRQMDELFENLGGHPMAAGFTIKTENIKEMTSRLENIVSTLISDEDLTPSINIDLELPINQVDLNFMNQLSKLKPFGVGNPAPVFLSRGLGVAGIEKVGRDSTHLSLKLFFDDNTYKAIFFNRADLFDQIHLGDKIDIVYTLESNFYKGKEYLNIVFKDLKLVS